MAAPARPRGIPGRGAPRPYERDGLPGPRRSTRGSASRSDGNLDRSRASRVRGDFFNCLSWPPVAPLRALLERSRADHAASALLSALALGTRSSPDSDQTGSPSSGRAPVRAGPRGRPPSRTSPPHAPASCIRASTCTTDPRSGGRNFRIFRELARRRHRDQDQRGHSGALERAMSATNGFAAAARQARRGHGYRVRRPARVATCSQLRGVGRAASPIDRAGSLGGTPAAVSLTARVAEAQSRKRGFSSTRTLGRRALR